MATTKAQLLTALQNANARAFLDMISAAEGTTQHGYYTLVGGSRLPSIAQHPAKVVTLSRTLKSTAAGRYQFLLRTWNSVKDALQLPDFGPQSQDIAALELIRRRGGLTKVLQGDLLGAINAVKKEWASFPGAGYGQGERSIAFMQSHFNSALARYGSTTPATAATPRPSNSSGGGHSTLATIAAPPLLTTVAQNPGTAVAAGGISTVIVIGVGALIIYKLFLSE